MITELEVVVMDWMVHAFGLPHEFTFAGGGGGSTQGTTSDGVFYAIAAAREAAIARQLARDSMLTHAQVLDKLVVYASIEVCIQESSILGNREEIIRVRVLKNFVSRANIY